MNVVVSTEILKPTPLDLENNVRHVGHKQNCWTTDP
jgi:hypothetical protein